MTLSPRNYNYKQRSIGRVSVPVGLSHRGPLQVTGSGARDAQDGPWADSADDGRATADSRADSRAAAPPSGGVGSRLPEEHADPMTAPHYARLRERAVKGDRNAVDELIELAGERGDVAELRRLSDLGWTTATDELVQLAGELGDLAELRRLAEEGNRDAADLLQEYTAD